MKQNVDWNVELTNTFICVYKEYFENFDKGNKKIKETVENILELKLDEPYAGLLFNEKAENTNYQAYARDIMLTIYENALKEATEELMKENLLSKMFILTHSLFLKLHMEFSNLTMKVSHLCREVMNKEKPKVFSKESLATIQQFKQTTDIEINQIAESDLKVEYVLLVNIIFIIDICCCFQL